MRGVSPLFEGPQIRSTFLEYPYSGKLPYKYRLLNLLSLIGPWTLNRVRRAGAILEARRSGLLARRLAPD